MNSPWSRCSVSGFALRNLPIVGLTAVLCLMGNLLDMLQTFVVRLFVFVKVLVLQLTLVLLRFCKRRISGCRPCARKSPDIVGFNACLCGRYPSQRRARICSGSPRAARREASVGAGRSTEP
ncbi:hypothetical protein C8R45DRAFT_592417 [Mycena sanguinolenta]|nr:hypothetical protein C8R45DRAFT_592417 [Mycena sanguinolenta]